MNGIWQWAWDRYGSTYSWAVYAVTFPLALPLYLAFSLIIVGLEGSTNYVGAVVVTVVATLVRVYILVLPGWTGIRPVEQWAAGHAVDRLEALSATYTYARRAVTRAVAADAIWAALLAVTVGAIAGATSWRLVRRAPRGDGDVRRHP